MPKYRTQPEVIALVRTVNADGEDKRHGDKIVAIQVQIDKAENRDGIVQFDVRDWRGKESFVIEIPLPEFIAALSVATLNRDES